MLLAKETGAIIVCSNPDAFEYKARQYGLDGIKFMRYDEFLNSRGLLQDYLIDEIDGLLKYINSHIIGYCLTLDD